MFKHYCRHLVFAGSFLLACGFTPNAIARGPAQEIELPSVQGWKIEATKRRNSVMCAARPKEESDTGITLLADTHKYRGGMWFLGVASRNQQLEPGIKEAVAYLSLEGKRVVAGKVLAVGDWGDNKLSATYVRFEFPAIDAYVKDIKAARVVELQAQKLSPLKLELLSPIITAIEECQQQSLIPSFWDTAKDVCN